MRVSWQPMIKILFESRAPATVVCPPLVPGEKSTNSTRTTRVNSEWFWRVMLLDESPMNSGTQSFESVSFFSFLMKNSTARKERSIKMKNSTNFGTCKNLDHSISLLLKNQVERESRSENEILTFCRTIFRLAKARLMFLQNPSLFIREKSKFFFNRKIL